MLERPIRKPSTEYFRVLRFFIFFFLSKTRIGSILFAYVLPVYAHGVARIRFISFILVEMFPDLARRTQPGPCVRRTHGTRPIIAAHISDGDLRRRRGKKKNNITFVTARKKYPIVASLHLLTIATKSAWYNVGRRCSRRGETGVLINRIFADFVLIHLYIGGNTKYIIWYTFENNLQVVTRGAATGWSENY